MQLCFTNQPFSYAIVNKTIVLKLKEKPAALTPTSFVAPINISGMVTDETGRPLPGVTVKTKDGASATATDVNGIFTLAVPDNNSIVVFSSVGYEVQEYPAKNIPFGSTLALKPTVTNLKEVVVNHGYYNTTKELNTGNSSVISSNEIGKQPVDNPLMALEGQMPGVFVQSGQGLPGTAVKIQIRGQNSISGGNNPLYIVDGVPFSNVPLNNNNGNLASTVISSFATAVGQMSPFNSIDPSTIESISVLKDAEATALYGARGSNGVVLITTKPGKAGKTSVDVNFSTGIEKATHLVNTINTAQYLQLDREAFANDGVTPTAANAPEEFWSSTQSTNYDKVILGNTARVTDLEGNISGGNLNTKFIFSGNYRKEGTVFPGDLGYTRGGGHLNVTNRSDNGKFNASLSVTYSSDQNNSIAQSIGNFNYVPNYPLYNSNGSLNWTYANYLGILQEQSQAQTKNLIAGGQFSYNVLSDLKVKATFGYNNMSLNGTTIYPLSSFNSAFNPINKTQFVNNAVNVTTVEPQILYNKKIGKGELSAIVGGAFQYNTSNGEFIQAQNFSNEALLRSLGAAGSITTGFPAPATNSTQYKYVSIYGNLNYNWADKYILDGNFRRDGSSRFGPGNRFGNFGAIGVAWLFSKENFIKQALPFLSLGKLRASYGIVGNDQIADYGYLATYGSGGSYQGVSSLQPTRIANPNYGWEVNKKMEVGLETGFLNDHILFDISLFRNRSNNQLVGYPLPSQTGFASYQANLPATVQNSGLEFLLTTLNFEKNEFKWNTSFNLSFIRNKLVSFPNLASSSYATTYVVGKPLTIVEGYKFSNIDSQTGLPLFINASGQKTFTPTYPTDQVVLGTTTPNYFGGITNTFNYKNLELSFLFQFVKQQGYQPSFWPGAQNFTGYMPEAELNNWKKPGDISDLPISSTISYNAKTSTAYYAWISSTRFWGDASYIRLKNLYISYSLPERWRKSIKSSQLKVFIQGQNLWTITKYPGSDPENPSSGLIIPTLRTITGGIKFTF